MSAKIFTPWLSRIPFSLSSVASTLWRLSMETMPLLVGSGMALFILLQDGRRARPGCRARTRASAPLSRIRLDRTLGLEVDARGDLSCPTAAEIGTAGGGDLAESRVIAGRDGIGQILVVE